MVTQECVSTPLIPIYLAAVFAYAGDVAHARGNSSPLHDSSSASASPGSWWWPSRLRSWLHRLTYSRVSNGSARRCRRVRGRHRRHGAGGTALRRAILGLAVGVRGRPTARRAVRARPDARDGDDWRRRARRRRGGHAPRGSQGAIALLPAFQVGLYLALWVAAFVAVGWRRFLAGLGASRRPRW